MVLATLDVLPADQALVKILRSAASALVRALARALDHAGPAVAHVGLAVLVAAHVDRADRVLDHARLACRNVPRAVDHARRFASHTVGLVDPVRLDADRAAPAAHVLHLVRASLVGQCRPVARALRMGSVPPVERLANEVEYGVCALVNVSKYTL